MTEAYQSHTADAATYLLTRGTGPYGRCRPSSSSPGLHLAIWSHFPCVISLPIGRNIPAFSSHRAFNVSSSSMGSGVRTSPTTRERAAPSKTASGIPPLRQHTLANSTSTWRRPFIIYATPRTEMTTSRTLQDLLRSSPLTPPERLRWRLYPPQPQHKQPGTVYTAHPTMKHPAATPRAQPEAATSERLRQTHCLGRRRHKRG